MLLEPRTSIGAAESTKHTFRAVSPNVRFLQQLYAVHAVIGLLFAVLLLIYPWGVDVSSALPHDAPSDKTSHFVAHRMLSCVIFGFVVVLRSFVKFEQVRFHKAMGMSLVVLHVTGIVVLASCLAAVISKEESHDISDWRVWINQLTGGMLVHATLLGVILWRPGFKWLRKSDTHQYVSFAEFGPNSPRIGPYGTITGDQQSRVPASTKHQTKTTPLQDAIHRCMSVKDNESRIELLQELWDRIDQDQNGVLSTAECHILVKEYAQLERQAFVEAMQATRRVLNRFHNPRIDAEAARLATLALHVIDNNISDIEANPEGYVAAVLERMDVDNDGQVDRSEFFERIDSVLFQPQEPIQPCPIQ